MSEKRIFVKFIPSKLEKLRKNARVTRNIFAKMVGTSGYQVKLWELGEVTPSTKKIEIMCNMFDVEPNYFFFQTEIKHERVVN